MLHFDICISSCALNFKSLSMAHFKNSVTESKEKEKKLCREDTRQHDDKMITKNSGIHHEKPQSFINETFSFFPKYSTCLLITVQTTTVPPVLTTVPHLSLESLGNNLLSLSE